MVTRPPGGIFQQKALDKLNSPEQLDKLFATTNPVGWVAMVTVLLLIFSGIIWSVFGTIANKVGGVGIIVDSGGVAQITHHAGGKVIELKIDLGDRVSKGQVVAVLEQPELEQEISRLRAELNTTAALHEMELKVLQLNAYKEKLERDSKVISSYEGVVIEENVAVGNIVNSGTSFAGISQDQGRGNIIALLYVPVLEGKKILTGMTAQIAPGAVDSSEYGSLVGRVVSVSDYPVSGESILNWTGNKEMTSWILQNNGGAAVEVRIDLIKDDSTSTGYLWSSILGSPSAVTPGTAFTGTVVVKRQAPLVKVFNKLSQWLRSD